MIAAAFAVGLAPLLSATPSAAIGSATAGTFLCENSIVGDALSTGTAAGTPQTLMSVISAPTTTNDVSTPTVVTVSVQAPPTGTLPLSPSVPLTGVAISKVSVRLDIYESATNSPTTIAGAPTSAALGVFEPAVALTLGDLAPRSPIAGAPVSVTIPPSSVGTRQWLRLKEFAYDWTATGVLSGSTRCRLVGAAQNTASGGTVQDPIFLFLTSESQQYPEPATDFTSGSATFDSFAARLTVTDVNGAGTGSSSSSCTVDGVTPCTTDQNVNATVEPGSLAQAASAADSNPSSTAIVLTADDGSTGTFGGAEEVTVGTTPQLMEGALNPVTVTDTRGGTAGWSLTAELSGPFTEVGGGQMAEATATLGSVVCAPTSGSATRKTGAGGTLSSAVTLCGVDPGVDDSAGQSGGGQYTVSGRFELTVPAFQKAGEYTSTLVITLT